MAKRKKLKGIAHGLLTAFVSRNNDIDGYWGLGILRLFAEKNEISVVTLDLINKTPNLPEESPVQVAEDRYREWFQNELVKAGVDAARIARAEINIQFSTFEEFPAAIRDTRGAPYLCTVIIARHDGPTISVAKLGCCEAHNPRKDLRSTRAA